MTKQFYYPVDATTGEVSQSKMTAQKRGGIAHIPAHALLVAPLAPKSCVVVIANDDLSGTKYIANFRGKTIFDTTNATQSKVVEELGEIEENWTLKQPLPHSIWQSEQWVQQLDLLQDAKHQQINAWRDSEEAKTDAIVIVDNIEWDANPSARSRIYTTLLSQFTPSFWTDANNVDQAITAETLQQIHTAIVAHGFAIHTRQREMKTEIKELMTVDEINEYEVDWSHEAL
ncbi:MAG: DUF4376 domain-containing protein [Psychromonas sp.]